MRQGKEILLCSIFSKYKNVFNLYKKINSRYQSKFKLFFSAYTLTFWLNHWNIKIERETKLNKKEKVCHTKSTHFYIKGKKSVFQVHKYKFLVRKIETLAMCFLRNMYYIERYTVNAFKLLLSFYYLVPSFV